jgi:hypothetical protein
MCATNCNCLRHELRWRCQPLRVHPGPERSTLQQLAKLRDHFARKAGRFTHAQVLARADRMRLNQEKRKTAAAVLAYQAGGVA